MSGADPGAPADPQPPPPPKPRLKINVSRSSSFVAGADPSTGTPARATATPVVATPSEGGGSRKVKLKVNASQPATPAETPITKTKAGRQSKPTQKLVDSKRPPEEDDDDDDLPLAHSAVSASTTKIKIRQTPKAAPTQLVVKPRGRPPVHPPGDGYDSEASDREIDPAIEEQLILRIVEGEHCDYVRQCMENNKIGIPRAQGGADFFIKFFDEESRRSMLVVKGQPFAGVLVDLPTITEAMKTWDKKSLMKSADVCQMLYFFQKVRNEEEARHVPLPSVIDSNFKWPHGLTPPMHDAVNRRFAKTISRKEIEDKEAEVERLLAEDAKASASRWEWVDERVQGEDGADDEDAEGEVDDSVGYFGPQPGADDAMVVDDDLEADLEAAFAEDMFGEPDDSATPAPGTDPLTTGTTPAPEQETIETDIFGEDGNMDDDDEDDDDDDDDDDEDMDDDQRAERDQESGVKAIIASMVKQRAAKIAERERVTNNILRNRLDTQIKQLTSEISLKKSSLGIDPDDEDED